MSEQPTPAPVEQPPAAPPPAPPAVSKEEFDALKAQLNEQQEAVKFWYEKATTKAPAAPEATKDKAAAEEVDLLDIITSRGAKGFEEYMRSRGFTSREEVEADIDSKVAQREAERDLKERYPDLKDGKSDFFKATAMHYGELRKAGVPETVAMSLAAERAELEAIRSGKMQTPQQKSDAEKKAREAERRARAEAQGSDRGGRAPAGEDVDDELDAEQKRIAQRMGVSEDAYKKRAKAGVQMSAKIAR